MLQPVMSPTIACYESSRSALRASLSAHAHGSHREESIAESQ